MIRRARRSTRTDPLCPYTTLFRALQPLAPAQRKAVALLQPSPEPEGRNAFAALWLLGRDVPEARLRQVVDADMQRIRAELARSPDTLPAGDRKSTRLNSSH